MAVKIVPMTKNTVSGVAQVEKACFSDPWSEKAFHDELKNPDAVTLVALAEQVAGFVNARKVSGEVYINNIAVAEPFRRQCVGDKLLRALEGVVHPYEFITLEVRKSNFAAQKLYEKLGYKPVGERRNFYASPTENAVLMTKFPDTTIKGVNL